MVQKGTKNAKFEAFFYEKSRENAQKTHFFLQFSTLVVSTQKPGEFRAMALRCPDSTFYKEHFEWCRYRVPSRALCFFVSFNDPISLH